MHTEILHSKIIGDKPKHLIILHGLFGQLDNWNTHGKKFSESYTTHLLDLRNHGRSFHNNDASIDAMVNDVVNYMQHYKIEKAHFIGHSLGGRIVINFALSYPNLVDHLVVADMAPKNYQPHHNSIFKALLSVDFDKVSNRKDVEQTLSNYIPEIGVRQFLLKNVHHKEDNKYGFRFNLPVLHENYLELITNKISDGNFDGPTLFLKGEKSDYILQEDEFIIKNKFPNSEIKTIANAGHWLHAENPTDFINEVLNFLK